MIGMAGSIQQGTIFGLASIFPPKYIVSVMSGMGIGGVLIGVIAMATEWWLGDLENGEVIQAWVYFSTSVLIVIATLVLYVVMTKTQFFRHYVAVYEESVKLQSLTTGLSKPLTWYYTIVGKTWKEALASFLVFFVTLSMFPGLMLQVQTEYVSVTYYNMLIPLEFNVFDTIGRSLPSIIKFPNWTVLPLVVSRIIFFPLIIFV